MKKVITTFRGTPHCLALCFDCDWSYGAEGDSPKDRRRVRNAIHTHIKKTGHKGHIETGLVSHYSLK